ncbi:MAG: hypothetical protein IPP72_15945 [Chitinophagaceae bacterium]|nr:hypothetical protein [Chitinophagaceae bacterium]
MRAALNNLFSNKITLENGSQYYYYVKPFELTNALGNVVALLQQYTFSPSEENTTAPDYKLYKTKEGNWYDVEEAGVIHEKNISRMLKSAIDKKEDTIISD